MDTHSAIIAMPIVPELAVIIPSFRHPVLLTEALDSALNQTIAASYVVIVCSDGCPFSETDLVASAYALSDPRVIYLRKPNGGPSSARNFAIDFAMIQFPTMRAVYFLDSDNRLTETALQTGYQALLESPGIGWVYSHIDSFGMDWTANYGVPYSPLLHVIYDNFCDTGSFVSREMLESGARFDEDARSGYEDWDFWLQGLAAGFRGKHTLFGFSYRQRPESRFREMNRLRGAMLEHLRHRHWAVANPRNLLRWEHETNPRYLLTISPGLNHAAFTDPAAVCTEIDHNQYSADIWSAFSAGDEIWTPAFYVFGSAKLVAELSNLGLSQSVFLLLERSTRGAGLATLTVERTNAEFSIDIRPVHHLADSNAVLWFCSSIKLKEALFSRDDNWFDNLDSEHVNSNIVNVHLRAPFAKCFLGEHEAPEVTALSTLLSTIYDWRNSPYRDPDPARWDWRPSVLPQRNEYYGVLCRYLGVSGLMPRVATHQLDVAFLVPIASYGGSEKVAYALAQTLRRRGRIRTHLFVLGPATMKILSEYEDAFDSVNFLADSDFPVWGGPITIFGENVFMPDAPEINAEQLTGFLGDMNLVINCQSAPANSVMGSLRRLKIKTMSYLHLTDASSNGRPSGHPYIALGFEHAYDLIATCSQGLADELHALGIPSEKIQPIANAASFRITDEGRHGARSARAIPRGHRKLRCLYLGRLDRQKGVERLLGCIEKLRDEALPVDIRIVGSSLIDESDVNWNERLLSLDVALEPPIFTSESLKDVYLWADVLILPSRWEGAPLVIPECQQLGCIPLCTNVGAVNELIIHDVDGLLVESNRDVITASALTHEIRRLIENDEIRMRMAAACINRGELNQWENNFLPLIEWIDNAFSVVKEQLTEVQGILPSYSPLPG